MTNELKERLEALSAEATSGPWDNTGTHGKPTDFGVYAPQGRSICSTGGFADGKDITYRQNVANAQFIAAVSNAFRSGDLITRQELDEAVAAEREACADLCEERADVLNDMGIEMECCVGTANNCADDIRGRGSE